MAFGAVPPALANGLTTVGTPLPIFAGDQVAGAPGPGDVIDGRFVLDRVRRRGRGFVVLSGLDQKTGERVLVRATAEPVRKLPMLEEAARLDHPNIRKIIYSTRIGRWQIGVTESYVGMSLRNWWLESGRDPIALLDRMMDALDALQHAHANDVVHGWITPNSLRVSHDGTLKLCGA